MHNNIYVLKICSSLNEARDYLNNNNIDEKCNFYDAEYFILDNNYYLLNSKFGLNYMADEYENFEEVRKTFLEQNEDFDAIKEIETGIFRVKRNYIDEYLEHVVNNLKYKLEKLQNNIKKKNVYQINNYIFEDNFGDEIYYDVDRRKFGTWGELLSTSINYLSGDMYFVLINILDYQYTLE